MTLLFFFPPSSSLSLPPLSCLGRGGGGGGGSNLTVPCTQNAVVRLIAAGTASFPFLPFQPSLDGVCDDRPRRRFPPRETTTKAKKKKSCPACLFETYRGFSFLLKRITCLQEICPHQHDARASGMFLRMLSVARKDLRLYFYLSSQIRRPQSCQVILVSFLR